MPKTKPMPGSDAFWAMSHKDRFSFVLDSATRTTTESITAGDTVRAMEAAGMKFVVNTDTAVTHSCSICGEAGQQGYAGTPPCFQTRSKRKLATLKRKGCVKGVALHTCGEK